MRYKELLEYKRDKTAQNLGEQLINRILLAVQSPLGNTKGSLQSIIPGIEISSRPDDAGLQQIHAALGAHINELLGFFENADPSPNKQYTEWIIRRYIDSGIRYLEDVDSTVAENLTIYQELKKRRMIPPELADIGRVKGGKTIRFFRDIWNIYRELPEQQEKIDKGTANEVYEDNEIRIVHPEDQKAACYYGQGTQWCTASTRSRNYFDDYNNNGNLFVILPKKPSHKGEKYQLHFESDSYMTENDVGVPLYSLVKKWPQLHKIFKGNIFNAYRGDEEDIIPPGNPSILLAKPETLENWLDITDNIVTKIEKELESPTSVFNWLELAGIEANIKDTINSPDLTSDMKFTAKKKLKWLDEITKFMSENKQNTTNVIYPIIDDLDELERSLQNHGDATSTMINNIPRMFPGMDTMMNDIGDRYVTSDLRVKVMNKVWYALTRELNPYFANAWDPLSKYR
jgi:hypothetical protein